MSQKGLNKKSIKIVGATSVALFSLVTVFTATIAWFSSNTNTFSGGMTIKVDQSSGRLSKIEIYEFVESIIEKDSDNNDVITYSFKDEPSGTIYGGEGLDGKQFEMDPYDPLDPDHPILILFTLQTEYISTTSGDMYIKGSTSVSGFLGETEDGSPVYTLGPSSELNIKSKTIGSGDSAQTVECYPLSSAVNFKCADYSSDSFGALLQNSTPNRIDILADSVKLKESFVNFASTGEGITFKDEPTIYVSPGNDTEIQYVAMVVNYDENAISAIYSTFLGNSVLELTYGGDLYFTCDWSLEVSV